MNHYFATCPQGAENLLAKEISELAELCDQSITAKAIRGGVNVQAELSGVYCLLQRSQLINRLFLQLAEFRANDPQELYEQAGKIDWSEHMAPDARFVISAKVLDSQLGNPHFLSLKLKDAIVDQFRQNTGQRPDVDVREPQLRFHAFVHRQKVQISLDLSGGGLRLPQAEDDSRYQAWAGNSALALADLQWKPRQQNLIVLGGEDIELILLAGLKQANKMPPYGVEATCLQHWYGHVPALWKRLSEQAAVEDAPTAQVQVIEPEPRVRRWVEKRLHDFGLEEIVRMRAELSAEHIGEQAACVILNWRQPRQLERARWQRQSQDWLAVHCPGWRVLSADPIQHAAFVGEHGKPKRRRVRRGRDEYQLLQYQIQTAMTVAPDWSAQDLSSEGAGMLMNRLRKNFKHLGRWAQRQSVHCYRLYDADIPEYAAAIDIYESEQRWVVVQEYAAPKKLDPALVQLRLQEILAAVQQLLELPPERIVLKQRKRQRGSEQYEALAQQRQFHVVPEAGLKIRVNFKDYLDTGLFLDHRLVREKLGEMADGQHCLNLFAYTGAASVHMAAGGARSVTTVDMSKTYLDWARKNMALNGFDDQAWRFVQADCLAWLEQVSEDPHSKRYGLVYLDPPTYSSSKRMSDTLDIQRDHVKLIRQAVTLLKPGGHLLFSNNYRRFQMDYDSLGDLQINDISKASLPEDFRKNPKIHQAFVIQRA